MEPLTVAIPVGPSEWHREYLAGCIDSVRPQLREGDEILLIDDMQDLPHGWDNDGDPYPDRPYSGVAIKLWRAPWRLGVAHAFNFGVALATNRFVLMLGADDELAPNCLEEVRNAIAADPEPGSAYFYLPLLYTDTGELQTVPCNAAVVSKDLWQRTGGFQPESAVGACDAAFISTLMVHPEAGRLVAVESYQALYYYRRHPRTDTALRGAAWQGPILQTRSLLTQEWQRPQWGRYE